MNATDIQQSYTYFNTMSATYFNSIAPIIYIYKLDKNATILNPIYNEEIDGRKYLRPFELHSYYKTNPFTFVFNNSIPSETDNSIEFMFHFDSMVQTIETLKHSASEIKITSTDPTGTWSVLKNKNLLKFYKQGAADEFSLNLNSYDTLCSIKRALESTSLFRVFVSNDDFSKAIPDFNEVKLENSVLLQTFNPEFKNATNIIEQGDLIYIPTTNALYEITAAFPTGNIGFKYTYWKATGNRTFAYVNYERLNKYKYGYHMDTNVYTDEVIQVSNVNNITTDAELSALYAKLNDELDKINGEVV